MIEILNNISVLFRYFVPGYCLLFIFQLITDRTKYDIKNKVLNSIILSVVLHSSLSLLHRVLLSDICFTVEQVILIEVALSLFIGLILGKLSYSQHFIDVFSKIFQQSPHSSIWHDICLPNKNVHCKAYMKDGSCVVGTVHAIETGKDHPYILISRYTIRDDDGDSDYDNYSEDSVVMVSMNNVDKLLIMYTDQK